MHWTRRVGLFCLGLIAFGMTNAGMGQDSIAVSNGGVVYLDDVSGSAFLSRDGANYVLFHKVVGDGVGHADGFTRIGVRSRLWENARNQLFGEVHSMITDDARLGFNVGGGWRRQVGGGLLGAHGWYDDYESPFENRYRQVTGGVEYLHPIFDIRANGYIPIDERENFIRVVDPGTMVSYQGRNLVTAGIGSFERAFHGWDLEGGGPVPLAQNWLRQYAGVYHLWHEGDNTFGFRARTEARFMEGVNLNFIVSTDDKFGTNLNLGIEVRFRGTMPTRFANGFAADRRYDQVRRTWPIQTHDELADIFVPLNDPDDGEPIILSFVDNSAPAGGDGSVENPLDMLPGMIPDADLILVRRGIADTMGNIALVDDQQLLGEGMQHFVNTDRLGVIPLPTDGFSNSGPAPTLVAATLADPIITLANNNLVSNFELEGDFGIAADGITDFMIDSIEAQGFLAGIDIVDASGTGVLTDLEVESAAGGIGISVSNVTGDPLNLMADSVTVRDGDFGLVIDADGGDIAATLTDVLVSGTADTGIAFLGTNADLTVDATDVTTNGTPGTGVAIDLSGATGSAIFDNLMSSNNGVDGLRASAINGTDFDLDVIDSILDGNVQDNLQTDVVDATSVLDVFVDPTSLMNAGENGYNFLVSDGGTLNATFIDVLFTGSIMNGINGVVESDGDANLMVTTFDATESLEDGLNLLVTGAGSTLDATFIDGNFSDSGSSAVDVTASNDAVALLDFQTVDADASAMNGPAVDNNVNWRATSGATLIGTWTNASISNGAATGINLTADGADSTLDASFTTVIVDNNTGDGINAGLTNGSDTSSLTVALDDVAADNSGGSGVIFDVEGPGANGTLTVDNSLAMMNAESGLIFGGSAGAVVDVDIENTDVFMNGTGGAFSGVVGTSTGTQTMVTAAIDDVVSTNNTLHGFELAADNGGSLQTGFGLEGLPGMITASLNDGSAIRVDANNADEIIVLTSGMANFADNGLATAGSGIHFEANTANLAVAQLTGSITGSGADGISVIMQDVADGAIDIRGDGTTPIVMNAEAGVDISLTDTTLTGFDNGTIMLDALTIDGLDVSDNDGNAGGFNGINIVSDNSDVTQATISNNRSLRNENGIVVDLNNNSDWTLNLNGNFIALSNVVGIGISSDSSESTNVITLDGNNDIVSNADTNIQLDFTGTADIELHIDENIVDGDGRVSGFTPNLQVRGDIFSIFEGDGIPPDTMGAVGIDHIVEFSNNQYAVYDKATGAELVRMSPDLFWLNAGAVPAGQFDPRAIYDPTVNRWFLTMIDFANGGNNIYLAVSRTENPLDGFESVTFVADSSGTAFNDFVSMGVDADGLYLATINFGGTIDLSVYSIPKADLLAPNPSAANMTRFENLPFFTNGAGVIQPVIDFGPSDGSASLLTASLFTSSNLTRHDLTNTDTPTALLSPPMQIPVTLYQPPVGGTQPGAPDLEHDDARFGTNVVEVNGSIWAAHGVLGASGNDAVRWYEIDEATNTVLQSGTIEDPNLDFLYPAIAVNETGQAVIGYTMVGPAQFASAGASFGDTINGQMTFQDPLILDEGQGNYFVTFGSGRNRWGDYSATVVDPVDSNVFWTFQLAAIDTNQSGVSITEIIFEPSESIIGQTQNDGINLNISGDAILRDPSSINLNEITGNMGDAIEINITDNGVIECLEITGNTINSNGDDTPDVNNTSTGTVIIK